jgi:F-type H+-transporting ATPase subunit gamma
VSAGKELRRRITSVKNTQQITKAMKLVAAARLKRAQELKVDMATLKTKIYIIGAILGTLGGILGTALARAIVGS